MFHKLRNRFLVLNMVIISVMMVISFAAIYMITDRIVRADIDKELLRIADFYRMPPKPGFTGGPGPQTTLQTYPQPTDRRENDAIPTRYGEPHDRTVSFAVVADAQGAVVFVESRFDMSAVLYETATRTALAKGREIGQIRADGNDWAYVVQPVNDGGKRLVFLDVTARQAILTNLVYTFAAVGLLMLVVIYFISRFFANRSIAPVKEAFDKQKRFIADASHELNTPLAVISANIDVVLANGDDTVHNQAKWLRVIRSETERLSKLTGDLLYLTQMDDERDNVVFAKFSMSEAVEHVVLMLEAAIYEKCLRFEFEIEPGLTAFGNKEQVKQVVLILLDNAMKYTNDGGSIRLNLARNHHEIVLRVSNTGEGIASEHLDKIFDRFYRTDPSRERKRGGYGLGLAIAKSIVEKHKGNIYAKSVPYEQTTIYVHLPLAS
jgi:signal transduction histidine kinase